MTEPQRPPSVNSVATHNAPPMPPPPPALNTQRQAAQTLDMSAANRLGVQAAPPPPPGVPSAAHRPGTPPPMPSADATRPKGNSSGLTLEFIIKEAYDKGFSDIHLGVGEVPRFRNRGEIQPTDYPETDKESFMSWLGEVMTESEINRFEETLGI